MKNENSTINDKWKMRIVIVIPCYNEEALLEKNILQILEVLRRLPHDIKIAISDNASKDKTAEIGKKLAAENSDVDYVFVGERGKGAAVTEAWKKYNADIYGFMDADLATDLEALPKALGELENNDIVVGSRRAGGAKVKREFHRRVTSAVLNFLIKILLHSKIKDTACGFKFFKSPALKAILPGVQDRKWTFDTEILILAERAGFKIREIPVIWEERQARSSRVMPLPTIIGYLKKIADLRKRP